MTLQFADSVTLANPLVGRPWGVLVDGQAASGPFDYKPFATTAQTITVGDLRSAGGGGQLIGFAAGHRPFFKLSPWTDGVDQIAAPFQGDVKARIAVRIVNGGPFDYVRVLLQLFVTDLIWMKERAGLRVGSVVAHPVNGARSFDFSCGQLAELKALGFDGDRINVYVVNRVDGQPGRGICCEAGCVAIGRGAGLTLLAHELGHALDLGHVDARAEFDVTNVMHSASNSRRYLTEGQTFRAHLHPDSAVHAVFQEGDQTWKCEGSAPQHCPPLHARVWSDGMMMVLGLPGGLAGGDSRKAVEATAPDAAALVGQWLATDCFDGSEEADLVALLKKNPEAVAKLLIEALEKGPAKELIEQVESFSKEQLDAVRAELENESSGFTPEQRNTIAKALESDTKKPDTKESDLTEGQRLDLSYRWRAAAGLALVADENGLARLREIAAGPESEARAAAAFALRK